MKRFREIIKDDPEVLYVDDIACACNIRNVENVWNAMKTATGEFGMTLNTKADGEKSAAMLTFGKSGKKESYKEKRSREQATKELFEICKRNGIPIVRFYKYLGTTIDNNLSINVMLDICKKQLNIRKANMSNFLARASIRTRINAFVTFALPILMKIPIFLGDQLDTKMN